MEKNLQFHPKKDRSKSIPTINMNLRLEALKDMKEDLLLHRCKISEEIDENDVEVVLPVLGYNFNDIKRKIMPQPRYVQEPVPKINKRLENNKCLKKYANEEEKLI